MDEKLMTFHATIFLIGYYNTLKEDYLKIGKKIG